MTAALSAPSPRACAFALLLAAASAQDWGVTGAWELVASSTPPPAFVFRKPAQSAGCFYAITNNTQTGMMAAAQFDIIANAWTALPDLPPQIVIQVGRRPSVAPLGGARPKQSARTAPWS